MARVTIGSPSAKAGLKEGDLLVAANSQLVSGLTTERVINLLTTSLSKITIIYKRGDLETSTTLTPTFAFDWKE